jgi:hypothetical protein
VTVNVNSVGQTITYSVQTVNPNDSSVTGPVSSATPVTFIAANADNDGDGMTNTAEDAAGTNPFSAVSVFRVQSTERSSPGSLTLTWSSVPGKQYYVDTASSPGGPYSPIAQVGATPNSATTSFTATFGTNEPARFYRVRLGP